MTIFVDASALVAIMEGEAEADEFADAIEQHNDRCYCAVGAWEAMRAIVRLRKTTVEKATSALDSVVRTTGLRLVEIGEEESRRAIEAYARYGKGRHRAGLNMGDCFAYACAKTNDARLLYKGDDFSHTDLA
ncbi:MULTISPECIES: type II toxin-antitoxin system VapC family toxin [unclassified Sphingomonas]|uniref:type II toxin-antitoxin system VapC family toxin n=1 Tax=unclassified Sphingomonas TaxID=196159 RepID=UPI000E1072AD|nr:MULTISPECIES: type II toxin-antitoxin system VapC family toxin [unclassified Sphingomonas]AXJ95925.1 type II toxin-antitoxin system VapC family toxin [Sphingomonas sp. FARSPH]